MLNRTLLVLVAVTWFGTYGCCLTGGADCSDASRGCSSPQSSPGPIDRCGTNGSLTWACNIDPALATAPAVQPPVPLPLKPVDCGLFFCAVTETGARSNAAALVGVAEDDPRLSCVRTNQMMTLVFPPQWAVCLGGPTPCGANPCAAPDGAGFLLGIGESCTTTIGQCCNGLVCGDANGSVDGSGNPFNGPGHCQVPDGASGSWPASCPDAGSYPTAPDAGACADLGQTCWGGFTSDPTPPGALRCCLTSNQVPGAELECDDSGQDYWGKCCVYMGNPCTADSQCCTISGYSETCDLQTRICCAAAGTKCAPGDPDQPHDMTNPTTANDGCCPGTLCLGPGPGKRVCVPTAQAGDGGVLADLGQPCATNPSSPLPSCRWSLVCDELVRGVCVYPTGVPCTSSDQCAGNEFCGDTTKSTNVCCLDLSSAATPNYCDPKGSPSGSCCEPYACVPVSGSTFLGTCQ